MAALKAVSSYISPVGIREPGLLKTAGSPDKIELKRYHQQKHRYFIKAKKETDRQRPGPFQVR